MNDYTKIWGGVAIVLGLLLLWFFLAWAIRR